MPLESAGILLYRKTTDRLEVLLAHPGGPLWARKDDGVWSIPKGLIEAGEEPQAAARREFAEETGMTPEGDALFLGSLRQKSGKIVHAWAMRGEFDPAQLRSNTFALEWPPRSGKMEDFPEVDRAGWFTIEEAERKIAVGQAGFLPILREKLSSQSGDP